jgi:hypothetical protein
MIFESLAVRVEDAELVEGKMLHRQFRFFTVELAGAQKRVLVRFSRGWVIPHQDRTGTGI